MKLTRRQFIAGLASTTAISFIPFADQLAFENSLEDYEEGMFTPVLTGDFADIYKVWGRYRKKGDTVQYTVNTISFRGEDAPDFITGLPF